MARWGLIVAVENYPNLASAWQRQLPGTNEAAKDFFTWITTAKEVAPSNVIVCADPGFSLRTTGNTKQDIVDAFSQLVITARGTVEELYVLFSGHGIGFVDDPNVPALDILVASEFRLPSTSGAACVRFDELKEKLRVALGPGKHFYFIDACRNVLGKQDIDPGTLGAVWGRCALGNATTYVLFSTGPGDVATVNSGFSSALLAGLHGHGRAKTWIAGTMCVTFETLCSYVQLQLKKADSAGEERAVGR